MAGIKGKKTVLKFGVTEATDLAGAETAATLEFPCLITNFTPPKETRAETTDESVYCTSSDAFKTKDTDEIEISAMTLTGLAEKGNAGYDAAIAGLKTLFDNDNPGCFIIVHPNGTYKQWANMKVLEATGDIAEGAPEDKIKFNIQLQLRTRLATV